MSDETKASAAAKALGKLGASKGGKARAEKLSPEQRSEIAKNAVEARWAKAEGETIEVVQGENIPKATHTGMLDLPHKNRSNPYFRSICPRWERPSNSSPSGAETSGTVSRPPSSMTSVKEYSLPGVVDFSRSANFISRINAKFLSGVSPASALPPWWTRRRVIKMSGHATTSIVSWRCTLPRNCCPGRNASLTSSTNRFSG